MPHQNWNPKNTRKYATDEERRLAAYQDWVGGLSYAKIAEKHGYHDKAAALRAVHKVRASFVEDAAEARDQATERIMGPLLAMRQLATGGDAQAAGAYKGLEERLSKLHGLDRPVQIETTGDTVSRIILDPRVLGIFEGGTEQP